MDLILIRRHQNRQNRQKIMLVNRKRRDLRSQDVFESLTEIAFKKLFRYTKTVIKELINQITPYMRSRRQKHGLTKTQKILATIRFLATGSYQLPVGQDFWIALSQTSISRAITEVCAVITNYLGGRYIIFPSDGEIAQIKEKFYSMHRMPGVIGVVDGTHISIKKPRTEIEHCYYSVRKCAHTKNVQIIFDGDYRILNIFARFGGASHDSFIWNQSLAKTHLEECFVNGRRNTWLLGDSGYAQRPWMMVPFRIERNPGEAAYNVAHKKTRSLVERGIGIMKSRFRCLSKQRILMYDPLKAGCIINACAILHNFLICQGYPFPPENEIQDEMDDDIIIDIPDGEAHTAGLRERDGLVENYF